MMTEIIAGAVSGAVSGLLAGYFGAKWQRSSTKAGRNATSSQASDGSTATAAQEGGNAATVQVAEDATAITAQGDGNRQAGRDYHEHQAAKPEPNLIVREDRSAGQYRRLFLKNSGGAHAIEVEYVATGAVRTKGPQQFTRINPDQGVEIGAFAPVFGNATGQIVVTWKNAEGVSFTTTHPLQ